MNPTLFFTGGVTTGKSGAAGKKSGGHNGAAPAASLGDRTTEHAIATGPTATVAGNLGSDAAAVAAAAAPAAGEGGVGGAAPPMATGAPLGSTETAHVTVTHTSGGVPSDGGELVNDSAHGKATLANSGLGKVSLF